MKINIDQEKILRINHANDDEKELPTIIDEVYSLNLKFKKKCFFSKKKEFFLIDFILLVRIKMDTSGSQQNSSGGNVILLNNNDLHQQRATLSSGQQVDIFCVENSDLKWVFF